MFGASIRQLLIQCPKPFVCHIYRCRKYLKISNVAKNVAILWLCTKI